MTAFRIIADQAARIELPRSIVDLAKKRFKDVYEMKILKGRNNAAISAACIFIACREQGVPRSFKEIVVISRVPKKEIAKCFKKIYENIKINDKPAGNSESDYIARFCDRLNLQTDVTMLAQKIADKVKEIDVAAGRNPLGISASAIFMAVHMKRKDGEIASMKDISDVCGIADSTAKQTCKLMLARYKDLVPAEGNFSANKNQLEAML